MNLVLIASILALAAVLIVLILNQPAGAFVIRHFFGIAMVLGSMLTVVGSKLQSVPHFGERQIAETIVEALIAGITTIGAYRSVPGGGPLAAAKAPPA